MKTYLKVIGLQVFVLIAVIVSFGFVSKTTNSYKCMVQMINYTGEGAYIVISLINPEGKYEETLFVQGEDDEWYHDLTQWWDFYGKKRNNIDAITGATVGGGGRSINIIEIAPAKIDAGYSLRFETAVEDKAYYVKDIEVPLTSESLKAKHEGTGYIRYVRMLPN